MPKFTAVEGDPFATPTAATSRGGPRLTPVDGDPFASATRTMSMGDAASALLTGEVEGQFLARQRVSPHVFAGKTKPQRLGELEEWDSGPAYRDANGQIRAINADTDFVAVDPET